MPEKPEIQRTRKSTAKSRQGCRTCKFRRVKCDEQRPGCLRCLGWGLGICGGYAGTTVKRPTYRSLQPALLLECHTGPRFQNEEEYRYYQFFRYQVAPHLSGAFENTLWDHLLAQACVYEPFVLDSVVSIGALSKAMSIYGGSLSLDRSSTMLESSRHESYLTTYEFSLKRYNKAIGSMKMALSDKEPDIRKVLMACLLIFCFETIIGNQASAVRHAQSAILLLHQWRSKTDHFEKGVAKTPYMIEDELVQAIGRLDLQILILLDLRPLKFHQALKVYLNAELANMPGAFMTLKDAKVWCELIMRRNYHFRAEASSVSDAQEVDTLDVPAHREDSLDFPMKTNVLQIPQQVPMSLLSEYQSYLSQWNRWSMAFRLLFTSLRASKHKDWMGAALLLIQAKMNCISLASAFSTLETVYDDFTFEFQEIMTLAESVHSILFGRLGGSLLYHFDGGIIPTLFFVSTKCRDRILRRQAIQLLSTSPWREGVFDSACVYRMAVWIMGVEEEGIEQEQSIPEHRRLKIKWSNIDLQRRRVHLRGTQFREATDTTVEWRDTTFTW